MFSTLETDNAGHSHDDGYVQMPGEGRMISLDGFAIVFKADGGDTRGAWSLAEYTLAPKSAGPSPHFHKIELQAFYVLSGTIIFYLGERAMRLPAGAFVLVPPRVPHTLKNDEAVPATVLLLATPAGIENYYEALAEMIKHEPTWPPEDVNKWHALMESYDRYPAPDADGKD